jgi:polyhydroxyalkanoate synthesis regulator phasin
MPAAKRSTTKSSSSSKSASSGTKRASTAAKRTTAAAKSGAKATATSTRKASSRTATQAKSGSTKTANAAKRGATATKRSSSRGGASAAAKTAGGAAKSTARTAASGAKGTATAARRGAKQTGTTAKASATRTARATGGSETLVSIAEQLARGAIKPRDVVMLTRDRIQEILDDAASRGRVTRKDANDLVAELVRRGRQQSDDLSKGLEGIVGRSVGQIEAATKQARKSEPVDAIVRQADRARRVAGVGPSFPILGYDDLTAAQVQSRLKELSKPEQRKVLTYERNNANRKSVTAALEKAIG